MTKTCASCKITQSVESFAKNRAKPDGLQVMCRGCKKIADAKHYASNPRRQLDRNKANRQKRFDILSKLKNKPCMDCGGTFPSYAMDFDHINDDKVECLSIMAANLAPIEVILVEAAKCEVVCATCHRIRTFNRKQASEALK